MPSRLDTGALQPRAWVRDNIDAGDYCSMIRNALIHRYDNKPDIEAVDKNHCSEVYQRVRDDGFEIVIVVPTTKAKTDLAVWGEATSEQYTPPESKPWPGRPDRYPYRVDMKNIKSTTLDKVRYAVTKAGKTWVAAWVVMTVEVETELL